MDGVRDENKVNLYSISSLIERIEKRILLLEDRCQSQQKVTQDLWCVLQPIIYNIASCPEHKEYNAKEVMENLQQNEKAPQLSIRLMYLLDRLEHLQNLMDDNFNYIGDNLNKFVI